MRTALFHDRHRLVVAILIVCAPVLGEATVYQNVTKRTAIASVLTVARRLSLDVVQRGDSLLIQQTPENYAIVQVIQEGGSASRIEIESRTNLGYSGPDGQKAYKKNRILQTMLVQAIDQEILGPMSVYAALPPWDFGRKELAYLLTYTDFSIGCLYVFDKGVAKTYPGLKWCMFGGSLLVLDLPAYFLVAQESTPYRGIGIAACIFSRFFLGSILVRYAFKENDALRKSGYRFDFREKRAMSVGLGQTRNGIGLSVEW